MAAATRPARARRSGCGDSSRRVTATAMGTSAGRRPLAQLLQVAGELARKVSRFRELVSRWAPGTRVSSGYFPEIPVGGAAVLGLLNYFAGTSALWWFRQRTGTGVLSDKTPTENSSGKVPASQTLESRERADFVSQHRSRHTALEHRTLPGENWVLNIKTIIITIINSGSE